MNPEQAFEELVVLPKDEEAIKEFKALAGWRIFATNVDENSMTLNQNTQYYRDDWLVVRGFHRLK